MTAVDGRGGELGAVDEDEEEVEGSLAGEEYDDELDERIVDLAYDDKKGSDECADPEADQGDVEVKVPKFMRRPGQPSKAEKEAHDSLHINYRSWCKHCVRGRRPNQQHRSQSGPERQIPLLC